MGQHQGILLVDRREMKMSSYHSWGKGIMSEGDEPIDAFTNNRTGRTAADLGLRVFQNPHSLFLKFLSP